eukprot:TRINITY_DN7590_c0_g1_i1.p2 TRINITY_DN7590_c0_g1~~TRINITY_DN7590_c0_g1_i1.p2  ORF type:complete len:139 (-),score=12.46 TRINITY_DN7590_c0_g1_i1:2759-3175(-)
MLSSLCLRADTVLWPILAPMFNLACLQFVEQSNGQEFEAVVTWAPLNFPSSRFNFRNNAVEEATFNDIIVSVKVSPKPVSTVAIVNLVYHSRLFSTPSLVGNILSLVVIVCPFLDRPVLRHSRELATSRLRFPHGRAV